MSVGEYNLADMSISRVPWIKTLILLSTLWLISACGESEPVILATMTPTESPIPTSTMTPFSPTATSIPMAVIVNGFGITLEEYEAELSRYLSAIEDIDSEVQPDPHSIVLEDLIAQILLAQGAEDNGFVIDEEALKAKLDQLITAAGGEAAFEDWLLDNGYSQQNFLEILERSIKAAWMRDLILADVPRTAEQVHVRQILLYNLDQANEILAELQSGRDFATLAASYEPVTQGDLGWFPRNFLPHPSIEEAAFQLQPGDYSEVIETSVGFHIIQVMEKDLEHPLSPEARLLWQESALRDWVAMQREQSDIVIVSLQ